MRERERERESFPERERRCVCFPYSLVSHALVEAAANPGGGGGGGGGGKGGRLNQAFEKITSFVDPDLPVSLFLTPLHASVPLFAADAAAGRALRGSSDFPPQ